MLPAPAATMPASEPTATSAAKSSQSHARRVLAAPNSLPTAGRSSVMNPGCLFVWNGAAMDSVYCGECGQRAADPMAFIWRLFGSRVRLCPKCAGQLCRGLVQYFAGRRRDGLTRKPAPKNPMLPRMDAFKEPRCRACESKLYDWKPGASPMCEGCSQSQVTA